MAAVVNIVSRCGLRIDTCHRNQPNISKLLLYKPLLSLYQSLKQLYMSNSYSVVKVSVAYMDVVATCMSHLCKRTAGMGYR